MNEPIIYKISFENLTQHVLNIECRIKRPNENGQILSLPNWLPGSYRIREFARHVVSITAECSGKPVLIELVDKSTWQCEPCFGELIINYQVYGFDTAPRGIYIDSTRVFFDSARVFLQVEGEQEHNCVVDIVDTNNGWSCVSSMHKKKVNQEGFGIYTAENHLDLIDHPFALGKFDTIKFEVSGIPHSIVVFGASHYNQELLRQDVAKICQTHADFFGGLPKDMEQYIFLLNVLNIGYGGLEHKSCSSLACVQKDLPVLGDTQQSDDYRVLLGLFSHEYFHLWNVKRIKPEVFVSPNLSIEAYTKQLWIFEGITSYYDNLNMLRSGVISIDNYLNFISKDINTYLLNPGADQQNLEASSFYAWTKFYQPDENSINTTTSYYLKGSLVAFLLDINIIKNSNGEQSLNDVMQVVWEQHGKTGIGLPEHHFEHLVYEVTGTDYSDFFNTYIRSTEKLKLADAMNIIGIAYNSKKSELIDAMGLKVLKSEPVVSGVLYNYPAQQAGFAPGDIIVAIEKYQVGKDTTNTLLEKFKSKKQVTVTIFRNGLLHELKLNYPTDLNLACELKMSQNLNDSQQLLLNKWLSI